MPSFTPSLVLETLEIKSRYFDRAKLARCVRKQSGWPSSTFDFDTTLNNGGNNARPSFILPERGEHADGGSRETNRRRETRIDPGGGRGDWLARRDLQSS